MKTVFIADAHLGGLDDPAQKRLVRFLESFHDAGVRRLVIVGDFFEFWTGFGEMVPLRYLPVLAALMEARAKGVEIVYVEGNHDFHMGRFFTDVLGARVHDHACTVTLDGRRVIAIHGDTIGCTPGYSLWRAFLRSPVFRFLKTVLPPALFFHTAARLSRRSRRKRGGGAAALERAMRAFARRKIAAGADVVITGHTHRPCVGEERGAHRRGIYANPGSCASTEPTCLVYEEGSFRIAALDDLMGEKPSA